NLKLIGLGCHNCNDTHGRLPPAASNNPALGGPITQNDLFAGGWGNPFFHLLPYIEQGNLYTQSLLTTPFRHYSATYLYNSGTGTATAQQKIKTYICPADPSVGDGTIVDPSVGIHDPFAVGCYAFNYQVFGYTGVPLLGQAPAGQLIGGPGG